MYPRVHVAQPALERHVLRCTPPHSLSSSPLYSCGTLNTLHHTAFPALMSAYPARRRSVATAPPPGLNRHWVRYCGGMVLATQAICSTRGMGPSGGEATRGRGRPFGGRSRHAPRWRRPWGRSTRLLAGWRWGTTLCPGSPRAAAAHSRSSTSACLPRTAACPPRGGAEITRDHQRSPEIARDGPPCPRLERPPAASLTRS